MTKEAALRSPIASRPAGLRAVGLGLAMQAEGGPPEFVHLLPIGPDILGRDGRSWTMTDPAAVIAASRRALPLPIDYNHASEEEELPDDGDAPAAAWIEDVELRADGIWGRTAWTPKGGARVAAKEYRFLSPSFLYDAATREVVALASAGLVHRPNLPLTALNRRGRPQKQTAQEQTAMKTVLAALGLAGAATEADAVTAINALKADHRKALNAAAVAPPLENYVPRAQHDETVKALNAANEKIAAQEKAKNAAMVADLIDGAVKAGKIAPAAKDHFTAIALNNFEATQAAIDAMPAIVTAGADPDLDRGAPEQAANGKTLTENQKATCRALGLTEEEYAKALG